MTVDVAPTEVTVEHLAPALGIGQRRPRLSWALPAGADGQQAYELEVLDRNGRRWAERVVSPRQTLVPWIGTDLSSRERRTVRVRVFDSRGNPSAWSAPVFVEAGLFDAADWTARYITSDEDLESPIVLRRRFEVKEPVEGARLYVSYRGMGEPTINGVLASDEVLAPGWQSYSHRQLFSTLDVSGLIRRGSNELKVTLADGWYRGRLGFLQQRALYGNRVALLAQLEIDHGNGRYTVVGSDESWEWSAGPILSSSLYDGESYDAGLVFEGGADPRSHGWRPVQALPDVVTRLEAPIGAPVRRTETVAARRVFRSPSGKVLVDFGQNLVGRVRLSVEGPAGTTIILRHAEVLEHGELGTRPLRSAAATDRYTLRGGEREQWEPRFTYHGFRYVQVDGWPGGEPAPGDLEAVVLHSDMQRVGWFSTSNADLDRLHQNVVWSTRGNFVSIPTDCPQRDERLGWTGDISVFAPTATYLYDCVGMLSSWLRDLALEQQPDGRVPFFVPDVPFPPEVKDIPGLAPSHTAVWGDAAVLVPFALYRASGDVEILERQYSSMKRWVDGVADIVGESLIWDQGFQFGDWLDPVAPPEHPERGATEPALVATAYFANSARLLAQAASLTGRAEDERRYGVLAGSIASAFRDRFLSSSGRLSSDTQTAYAIALCLDLLPEAGQRRRASERLVSLVRESGHRIATGFVGTALVLDALVLADAFDDAYALLLQTECPSWLYPVRMGATTVWERWDSMLPDGSINPGEMTSFNHYALGAVADWLHRNVGGLSAAEAGWTRIRIAPRPHAFVTDAATSHRTPFGVASVKWQLSEESLHIEVAVPPGISAVLELPGRPAEELPAGTHSLDRDWNISAAVGASA